MCIKIAKLNNFYRYKLHKFNLIYLIVSWHILVCIGGCSAHAACDVSKGLRCLSETKAYEKSFFEQHDLKSSLPLQLHRLKQKNKDDLGDDKQHMIQHRIVIHRYRNAVGAWVESHGVYWNESN